MATNGDCSNLTMDSIYENIVKMEYVYRKALELRAAEIKRDIQQVCAMFFLTGFFRLIKGLNKLVPIRVIMRIKTLTFFVRVAIFTR